MKYEELIIPSELTMEDLGHNQEGNSSGFCHSYSKKDILEPTHDYELTCSLFGYEIGEKEASLLLYNLHRFVINCAALRHVRNEKEVEE